MLTTVLYTNKPTIKLNGIDISEISFTLSLTESLFDPVLKGYVKTINTAPANIYQVTKALGELNKIEFSFHSMVDGSPEKEIVAKDLYVFDIIPEQTNSGSNVSSVVAHFASKPYFINNSRLISKFYEDKISGIVQSLCKEIDIDCQAESTDEKVKKLLPYDSPFSHIIGLCKQAKSAENPKDMDFTFYQDIDAQYHFKRISKFKEKDVKWKYKMFHAHPNMETMDAKYSIIRCSSEGISPMQNALNGLYSSEIISFDTTTGNYYSKTHVYKKDKYTTISNEDLVDISGGEFKQVANSGVAVRKYNKQRFLFDCSEEESGQDKVGLQDDWVGNRLAAMQQLDQVILYLNVVGNSEIKVGDIIEVRNMIDESQINEAKVKLPLKDVIETGKFLITTISHDLIIQSGGEPNTPSTTYTMRIRAVKDSKGGEYA